MILKKNYLVKIFIKKSGYYVIEKNFLLDIIELKIQNIEIKVASN